MCGRFALDLPIKKLPAIIQKNLPKSHKRYYQQRSLIKPREPVLALRKNEGKTETSLMLWGLIPHWSKNPFCKGSPMPFNARSETINEKATFKTAWRNHRCLIPASCFYEKNYRLKANSHTFWIGAIWDRWTGCDGSEIDSCAILTTEPNSLVKPLHSRMPVVIPEGLEEEWMRVRNGFELKQLEPFLEAWEAKSWIAESLNISKSHDQLNLFK